MPFWLPLLLLPAFAESDLYPTPRFTDPERAAKLESAFPQIDEIFRRHAAEQNFPGLVWGVVIDGRLAHVNATGVQELAGKSPVTPTTVFRIASMTKSFTALAILKLRDEGKLSLEDPVSRWVPEFARMSLPTRDSGPIRIRHLMTHGAGFPEDNPWGDQQLGISDSELNAWLKKGIPFSTPPGTTYEYSNYGFGLLGRIVSKASGQPYEQYLTRNILLPLGMTNSTLEPLKAPATARAVGYRRQMDGSFSEEPPLPHGAFGSMGGLLTTAQDLAKYVAFQLSAWPARDDADNGPVRRDSVREMNHLWRPSNVRAQPTEVSGYGYGLRVSSSCLSEHSVGHGGGLPGFGSYMMWLPEAGVGFFAMANKTYARTAPAITESIQALARTGGLKPRQLPLSKPLAEVREALVTYWKSLDAADLQKVAAMNLLLDWPAEVRRKEFQQIKQEVGACTEIGPVTPENWLRGQFPIRCERGNLVATFTLAPTQPPLVQQFYIVKGDAVTTRQTTSLAQASCKE